MIEERLPLSLPPGYFKNGTPYQAQSRWTDGNLVRFLDGTIRAVGGWRMMADAAGTPVGQLTGKPRGIYSYRDSTNALRLKVGTHLAIYNVTAGVLTDVTPASGFTTGIADGSVVVGTTQVPYGDGDYGDGPYGGGVATDTEFSAPDTWQIDSFGDDSVAVFTADGKLLATTADNLYAEVTAGSPPTNNRAVVVTPERFVALLGADADSRKVQWSDQEDYETWSPSATNQAGDFTLTTEGRLVCGRRVRRATLLLTDTDAWTMNYIGGTLVYAFDKVGDQCGTIGPNAIATSGSRAFWMGRNNFFAFDGWVQTIPSDVRDYVFSDINLRNGAKVACATNGDFDEVTWFYPSAASEENDRYVTYNYRENHWVTGTLARAAVVDRGASVYPIWVDTDGYVWEHEVGDFRSELPYLESGPVMLGKADRVMRIQKLIPDEKNQGSVDFFLTPYFEPWDALVAQTPYGPYSTTRATSVRLTGRFLRLRFREKTPGWRVGTMIMGVRPQGKR